MSTLMLFALNVVFLASLGSTFVLDRDTCIAYPPCYCSGYDVRCDRKGLTTFPTFRVSNITRRELALHFYYNKLTTIPSSAFSNITVSNRTRIHLYLYNNQIDSIPKNAFRGIENAIYELWLNNNNFAEIPSSLKRLQTLESLHIENNPILSLSSSYSTLYSLRYTLRELIIDLKGFNPPWPVELNVLKSLTYLYVTNLNMTHLEYDTLQAFEDNLSTLIIRYSNLERIPVAICHLKKLRTIKFIYNKNVHTNSTIYEPCNQKLTTLSEIYLNGNNLRYMPDILNSFQSFVLLYLSENKLSYIDWDLVPTNSYLNELHLDDNNFTRIPSAISKLTKLQNIWLNHNKITSIEEFDFNTLTELSELNLNLNPIEYISPNAFKYNSALTKIYLGDTNIKKLPSSLASLVNLGLLGLTNSPIQCNCDLSFMRTLNIPKLTMYGNCGNIPIMIQTFLISDLPHCP